MTRAEAIEALKGIAEEASESEEAVCYVATDEDIDALNMAIQALEHDKKEIINTKSVFNLSEDAERGDEQ